MLLRITAKNDLDLLPIHYIFINLRVTYFTGFNESVRELFPECSCCFFCCQNINIGGVVIKPSQNRVSTTKDTPCDV